LYVGRTGSPQVKGGESGSKMEKKKNTNRKEDDRRKALLGFEGMWGGTVNAKRSKGGEKNR